MVTIVARHRVGDFDTWTRAHEERAKIIGQASSSFKTFQDVDDPNSIVLVIETDEPGRLAAMMDDPQFAAVKASHTVIDPIVVSAEVKCELTKEDGLVCRVDQDHIRTSREKYTELTSHSTPRSSGAANGTIPR
jgi:hypothetical protein